MSGIKMYLAMQETEERANRLGFRFVFSSLRSDDVFGLAPNSDQLPIYHRDVELFAGTLSEVKNFLRGIEWARKYDEVIGACNNQRRAQYEEKEVARLERIKYNQAKAKTFKILNEQD